MDAPLLVILFASQTEETLKSIYNLGKWISKEGDNEYSRTMKNHIRSQLFLNKLKEKLARFTHTIFFYVFIKW